MKTLDVSGLKSLRRLACNGGLQTLTVNGADKLEVLDCSRNKLTALDVSELKRLRRLDCSLNPDMSSIVVNGADG